MSVYTSLGEFYSQSTTEYCERVGNNFYSEPANALSNIAFFFFAFLTYSLLKKHKIKSSSYWFLFSLIILIGTGSTLWHSFRNPFTGALDAVPIYIFLLSFLYLLIRKLTSKKYTPLILVSAFLLSQVVASFAFPDFLNGSIRYFVSAATFLTSFYWLYKKQGFINKSLLTSLIVFSVAILFRSIDNSVCSQFQLGTHFLWHIFTSMAAYFAIKGLVELDTPER